MFRLISIQTTLNLLATSLFLTLPTQAEVRSVNGWGNNIAYPSWGSAISPLLRIAPAIYPDDMGTAMCEPPDRENTRIISNVLSAQPENMQNEYGLTSMAWHWGQFIDHDISLTETEETAGTAPISTASDDLLGPNPIPFTRSSYDHTTGDVPGNPRQQMNQISAFLDASMVYGSDASRSDWLREGVGGRLITGADNLLPHNDGTRVMAGPGGVPSMSTDLFVAGDVRANVQVGLTALHTVFAREHNRLVGLLATEMPGASDEDLYQTARRIVGAEVQTITYQEFLPAILGGRSLPTYTGYKEDVNPSIANEFSTALFRVGHTMLSPEFQLVETDGTAAGSVDLRESYFNPSFYGDDPENIDRVLAGLVIRAQEIDCMVIDDVRNFLFGSPGSGGMDLAALNMQRGRDHGLPDYNTARASYGLLAKTGFLTDGLLEDGATPNGITADPELAATLQEVYGSIDNVDLWMGALSEEHLVDSGIGELLTAGIIDQFTRLRDGDRFFYQIDLELSTAAIEAVINLDDVTLRDILEWNTDAQFASDNLFVVPEPASGALVLLTSLGVLLLLRKKSGGIA